MIYGSVYDSINESALHDVAPYEFDESMTFQEMGAQMIEEAAQDWNKYMQAVALTELSYVIENHQEYIYEGVDISAMITKVKEWFKKLWAKIQGIAKSAMAKFMSFGKNDEAFIAKYEADIHTGATKLPAGFSYKGYKFEGLAEKAGIITTPKGVPTKWSDIQSMLKASREDDSNDGVKNTELFNSKRTEKHLDEYRGKLTGAGTVTAGEFKKALKKDLYGSLDKEYIKSVDASKLIGIVKGAKEAIDAAKESEKAIKDDIDEKISTLDDLESEIRGRDTRPEDAHGRELNNKKATIVNQVSSLLKSIETVNAQWFSAYITALKDQNRQAKAVCTKLISYANGVGGKKSTNESVGSLLEDRFAALDFD